MSDPHSVPDGYALAVGRLCIKCAVIDRLVRQVIQILLLSDAATSAAIMQSAGESSKLLELMIRLARVKMQSHDWLPILVRIETATKAIQSERNRIVHDDLFIEEGTLIRVDRRATAGTAQAFQPKTLQFDKRKATSEKEIKAVCDRAENVIQALAICCFVLAVPYHPGLPTTQPAMLKTLKDQVEGYIQRAAQT